MSILEIHVDHEIVLKQISLKYAEDLFYLIQKNLKTHLCYWCPDLKVTYSSLSSTRAHINDAISKFDEDNTPDFLIFKNNTLAGLISLSPLNQTKTQSEIGYWLSFEFEKSGVISRSIPFVLKYAKENLRLKSVNLSTAAPNLQSQKIPIKFGFVQYKIFNEFEVLEDRTVDHILWRLVF